MFEPILLDANFDRLQVLDIFHSFIWTDRYWAHGDFEITLNPNMPSKTLTNLASAVYLALPNWSEHHMFLETIKIEYRQEDGDLLVLKGKSLESMLNRRIIWIPTTVSGSFELEMNRIIDENIIIPTDINRAISNFIYLASSSPRVSTLTIDNQYADGQDLLKVITDQCKNQELGFKILWNPNGNFYFEFYDGIDRSYGQSTNSFVVFSPEMDNLLGAEYIETGEVEKTVALVGGAEGVGNIRTYVEVEAPGGGQTGLDRREMFVSSSISRNLPDGSELTEAEYAALLHGNGEEELAKKPYIKSFDGEVDTTTYVFGVDFGMGDILQIADAYGHEGQSRVTEMIYSQDKSGVKMFPTFTTVD